MKPTYLLFLLDETGSMSSIKDDTIGGFNSFLDALSEEAEFKVTVIKWDSNKQEVYCLEAKPGDVPLLTKHTYHPGAATPLIDVMCNAIKKTEEKITGKDWQVQIVVQTDGHENASVEYTTEDLHKLVKEKTDEGWLFTFVGAGIDAFDAAGKYGISSANTMSYDRQTSAAMFNSLACSTNRYATSGDMSKAAFTSSERKSTGGHMPSGEKKKKKKKLVNINW